MSKRPALSKAELEIARTLWGLGQGTVRQVHAAVSKQRALDFTTVQTYLRRLEAKGYLRTRQEGRAKVYIPRVSPSRVVRETVADFMNRLFDGELMPMLRHLILDRGISHQEIDHLRELLDQLERQRDGTQPK